MSRSGYTDDCETWDLIRWRGAVTSALRGKRGQQALREILAALDALPEKKLAAESLVTADGAYCTLGALGASRGLNMADIDPEDRKLVADVFGVAEAMAAEIMFLNDEAVNETRLVVVEICGPMRPHYPDWGDHKRRICVPNERAAEQRWQYMRDWVAKHIEGTP